MRKIFFNGNVGRNPETRYAQDGKSFVTFSVAVNVGTKDNQKTDWYEVSCNGRTAEIVAQYVKAGTKVLVEGTPSVSAWINKEGQAVASQRVNATNVEMLSSKEGADAGYTPQAAPKDAQTLVGETMGGATLAAPQDDMPF
jgi:single-strand DNA-binding protein